MAKLDLTRAKELLDDFEFRELFVEELGWGNPRSSRRTPLRVGEQTVQFTEISQLGGVLVLEVDTGGEVPDASSRKQIHAAISKLHHENVLIFVDGARTQSLWYWVKRDGEKAVPRNHLYVKGQPADLFLSKLNAMMVDLGDFDAEGNLSVVEVTRRLRDALDVERVTKKFYREFQDLHERFVELIEGIDDERDRKWYASILLNRLMFIYFLQRKGFLDGGNDRYLQEKLTEHGSATGHRFYGEFLPALFFEGFAKPEAHRSEAAKRTLGTIPYLNGGLFLRHRIELSGEGKIRVPNRAFDDLLTLFRSYDWHLDDSPGGNPNEISPDVLGYIFEKYINQKAFGAYYTRTEITEYLCEQTIHRLILQRVNTPGVPGAVAATSFDSLPELLLKLDAPLCRQLWEDVLPNLSLLDPACGSGAFLVAAMKTLVQVYSAVIGRIKFVADAYLTERLQRIEAEHPSINYYIKKRIIADNLFGVDLMEEATEIAKLRLFLALVASVKREEDLEPLPNLDFNILPGNSLIGLLNVDERRYDEAQQDMFGDSYRKLVDEKTRLVREYRHASSLDVPGSADERAATTSALQELRDRIDQHRDTAVARLNAMLLDEFGRLGIRYEEATWDLAKNKEGKPKKRPLTMRDIRELQPFHWGYEFDEVIHGRGGFDAIITNPPWDIWQTDEKEFFQTFVPGIQKNKLRIEDWKEQQSELMKDTRLRQSWIYYASRFPHPAAWYKRALHFANQRSLTADGKKIPSKINLYTYFVEQCYNLLRSGGECGIVIPSGIYTDLGAKQLREMLFSRTYISGLFGFENRKEIFEGVHRSFKFVVLTFEKGGSTERFPAAFMRLDVEELRGFPQNGAVWIAVELVRRLSPDSLSVMEFKSDLELRIAEKLNRFPLLGQAREGAWQLRMAHGLNMTTAGEELFKGTPERGRLPLFEGKMMHQFSHTLAVPRYWVPEKEARKTILGRELDAGQTLYYQDFYFAYRRIGRNSDERTMICSILPRDTFASDSLAVSIGQSLDHSEALFLIGVLNSFSLDFDLRQRVSANVNMFYVYQLPVPRLNTADPAFAPIVERAARLVCTTPEFDDLALEVGLGSHVNGATDPAERARLRAELDGLVAHLYGLTEEEFTHVLGAFPLVTQQVKAAALEAFRSLVPNPTDMVVERLIAAGENTWTEFKVAAAWNPHTGKKDDSLRWNVVREVAAFCNSSEGGNVFLGVKDDGTVIGLAQDYAAADSGKPTRDDYELFLRNVLASPQGVGAIHAAACQITFHTVDGKEICRIYVPPALAPAYAAGELYVRNGNQSRKLTAQEAHAYIASRWN
jgi:hypothetical protein